MDARTSREELLCNFNGKGLLVCPLRSGDKDARWHIAGGGSAQLQREYLPASSLGPRR